MTEDKTALLKSLSIERGGEKDPRATMAAGGGVRIALVAGAGAFFAVLILGGAVLLRGGGGGGDEANDPEPVASAASSETAEAGGGDDAAAAPPRALPRGGLVASGYVVARRRATVSPQVSGQLRELYVEEGARVETGQILAKLDDAVARFDYDLAQADAASARARIASLEADLIQANRALNRTSDLTAKQFSSDQALDDATARVATLKAALAGARADLAAAEAREARAKEILDRHTVRAPFDGVVIDKNAQPGEFVAPASAGGEFTRTGVYTLVDMESLELEVDVNEGQIGRVQVGGRAEAILDAYTDWRIPARVVAIIPTADRSRATIQVRVGFDVADERILPEMAAKVTFLEGGAS